MAISLVTVKNLSNRFESNIASVQRAAAITQAGTVSNPSTRETVNKIFDMVEKRHQSVKKNIFSLFSRKSAQPSVFENYTLLFNADKNAFDYIMNSSNDKLFKHFAAPVWKKHIENLSLNTVKEIEKGLGQSHHFFEYVTNSDTFNKSKESVMNMSNYLSKKLVKADFTAYRGERNTGLFDAVKLDEAFSKTVRELVEKSTKSKTEMIYKETGTYYNNPKNAVSLYDYIKNKKELTLSDAMQAARFGDKDYIADVVSRIKSSKITDNRFKSVSLNKDFVSDWISREAGKDSVLSTTTLNNKIKIKAGNQCEYVDNTRGGQLEFVLNNNNKMYKFNEVKFDPYKNQFILESEISSL